MQNYSVNIFLILSKSVCTLALMILKRKLTKSCSCSMIGESDICLSVRKMETKKPYV